MYEIGARIRKYREACNLSQKEFAVKIGVSNGRVSNWELGINRPDVDILSAICTVLKVSPSELLDFPLPPNELSNQEQKIISQYRANPGLQHAVHLILGIND
jgi:transcriptional regulator with XRE-family HTH domain